jgi:hypothetical protein
MALNAEVKKQNTKSVTNAGRFWQGLSPSDARSRGEGKNSTTGDRRISNEDSPFSMAIEIPEEDFYIRSRDDDGRERGDFRVSFRSTLCPEATNTTEASQGLRSKQKRIKNDRVLANFEQQ